MLLELNNLSISFQRFNGGWKRKTITPVSDITLSVRREEIVALVGASGAGKSLLAHALLGLLPQNATMEGRFSFKGNQLKPKDFQLLRGKEIALIPQSVNYLNPLKKIRKQVYRSARLSGRCCCTASSCCDDAFRRYKLEDEVKSYLPFQISGGMARRVLTATATVGLADLIIADEPTTGLDQVVTEQSLNHLQELARDGKGILFITHDLDSATKIADTIVVVYNGATMEMFPTRLLHSRPSQLHPYTRALWQALPQNGFIPLQERGIDAEANGSSSGSGCGFIAQCSQATEICSRTMCSLSRVNDRLTRCHNALS